MEITIYVQALWMFISTLKEASAVSLQASQEISEAYSLFIVAYKFIVGFGAIRIISGDVALFKKPVCQDLKVILMISEFT